MPCCCLPKPTSTGTLVHDELGSCKLLVAAHDKELTERLKENLHLTVMDIDAGPTPIQERMSLALLEAVASEKLRTDAHVVVLYNGIAGRRRPSGTIG